MRSKTDHRVIDLLLAEGPLDRPGIAALSGLSRPSTAELVEKLIKAGLVEEHGEEPNGRRGPNAMRYRLRSGRGLVAGLEIQPDHAEIALADVDGTVLDQRRIAARRGERPTTLVRRAVRRISDPGDLVAVVVGTPGVVDRQGVVSVVWEHPHWTGPHRQLLENLLEVSVVLENDTNLAALAEHRYGAATEVEDFALLRFTDSLSAGLILDGRLVRGAHGAAGEIGFHPYAPNDSDLVRQLAEAVIGLCSVIDPELAVLSGPRSTAELAQAVQDRVVQTTIFRPRVIMSGLESGAVVRGALARAWELGRERIYFG